MDMIVDVERGVSTQENPLVFFSFVYLNYYSTIRYKRNEKVRTQGIGL